MSEDEKKDFEKEEEERLQRALQKNKKGGSVLFKKLTKTEVPPKNESLKESKVEENKPIQRKTQSEEEIKRQEEIERKIKEREKQWEEEKERVKTQEYNMSRKATNSNPQSTNYLKVKDEEAVKQGLSNLYDNNNPTSYIVFRYTDVPNEIEIDTIGEGQVEDIRDLLKDDQIQFAIIQEEKKGDYGSTNRYSLMQWIGKDVPPGMQKARASSHRIEIVNYCKKVVHIGGEFQANSREEITVENVTKSFGGSTIISSNTEKKESVEGLKGGRGKKLENLRYENEDQVSEILQKIHTGELTWCIMTYSKTENGVIELVESGTGGAEELAKRYPEDRIFFCPISVPVKPNPKFVLVTCVGPNVPPLQKARCTGEVSKVADKIKSIIPFHAFYQPIDAEGLTDTSIMRKLGN
eukprot:TRINITY_DN1734_c1_g2_i1.p1 TRINITY_DN1734_c1_g2~~TRINITY_DN1734_c1_g2_i1.p1  ORF type:complete len:409 (+),score=150.23 TRINITY_DN1734_c1_g2_i1:29-1255(+)